MTAQAQVQLLDLCSRFTGTRATQAPWKTHKTAAIAGVDQSGIPILVNVYEPVLITGLGSVDLTRTLLASLVLTRARRDVQLAIVTTRGELGTFDRFERHLVSPVATTESGATWLLNRLAAEVDRRTRQQIAEPALIIAVEDDSGLLTEPRTLPSLYHVMERGPEAGCHVLICTNNPPRYKFQTRLTAGKDGTFTVAYKHKKALIHPAFISRQAVQLSAQPDLRAGSERQTTTMPTENMAVANTDAATTQLAARLFRAIRHTLMNRRLCQDLKDGGVREVSWMGWQSWPDRRAIAFIVDTGTLPVSLERLADPNVAHQVSSALGGRRVEVVNHRGLAFVVGADVPELEETRRHASLPRSVTLDLDTVPEGRFMVPLGVGTDGPVWHSLTDLDCILVGGTRGGGKTSLLFCLLASLLTRHGPAELQVAIVDPKRFDFVLFDDVPQQYGQRATDAGEAIDLLSSLVTEMEDRGEQFERMAVRNVDAFNRSSPEPLPYILLIIDEVTDLVLQASSREATELQKLLIRLVSKGRAAGIIVVTATQNPKSEVFSTLARGNFKTRVAFPVPESAISRTILGRGGAEKLPTIPGRLMALVEGVGHGPTILQGYFISDEAIRTIVAALAGKDFNPLNELEREMVRYAVEQLDGRFVITKLLPVFEGRISKGDLMAKAQAWERKGWLTQQRTKRESRQVREELLIRAGLVTPDPIVFDGDSQDG